MALSCKRRPIESVLWIDSLLHNTVFRNHFEVLLFQPAFITQIPVNFQVTGGYLNPPSDYLRPFLILSYINQVPSTIVFTLTVLAFQSTLL